MRSAVGRRIGQAGFSPRIDDLWRKVQGLPDTAKLQVPGTLSESTKKMLSKRTPEEVRRIVLAAIEDINNGSVEPLDTLIKNRL